VIWLRLFVPVKQRGGFGEHACLLGHAAIGPQGRPVWFVTTGKRGRPSQKVLPPEVNTIEAAMAEVERIYK
jgi:hypothetical protein